MALADPVVCLRAACDDWEETASGPVLLMGGTPHPAWQGWQDRLTVLHPCKPDYDRWQRTGVTVLADEAALSGRTVPLVLVLPGKNKVEALGQMAAGWAAVAPGGRLIVAADKEGGAASLEKAWKQATGLPVQTSARAHARAFSSLRSSDGEPFPRLAEWQAAAALTWRADIAAWSCPGLYNWDRVDAGSALLAAHLPPTLRGRVADFGAGWGFLSLHLLRSGAATAVTALDLYEADARAVYAAQQTLTGMAPSLPWSVQWADVLTETPSAAYDVILCNPPFHAGLAVDIALGQGFLQAAARALRPGGTLWLVANRQLPYETVLKQQFRTVTLLAETSLYKVIQAVR